MEKKPITKEIMAAAALSVIVSGQAVAQVKNLEIVKKNSQQIEKKFEKYDKISFSDLWRRFSDDGDPGDGNNYKNPNDSNELRLIGDPGL